MKQFLHIDLPCHENWEAMAPVKGGRFCGSCTKRVIDFTRLTDAEILETIRNAGGNCCGRFTSRQLDRPLGAHSAQRAPSRMPAITAAFTFSQPGLPLGVHSAQRVPFRMPAITVAAFTSFLLVQALPQAHAQQHLDKMQIYQVRDTLPAVSIHQEAIHSEQYVAGQAVPYCLLVGVVVDEQGMPLRGITINVEGQRAPGSSDESGRFFVRLPLSATMDQPLHLRLSDNHHHVQRATVTLRGAGDALQICFRNTKAN